MNNDKKIFETSKINYVEESILKRTYLSPRSDKIFYGASTLRKEYDARFHSHFDERQGRKQNFIEQDR